MYSCATRGRQRKKNERHQRWLQSPWLEQVARQKHHLHSSHCVPFFAPQAPKHSGVKLDNVPPLEQNTTYPFLMCFIVHFFDFCLFRTLNIIQDPKQKHLFNESIIINFPQVGNSFSIEFYSLFLKYKSSCKDHQIFIENLHHVRDIKINE